MFCFETKQPKSVNNIRFIPVNKTLFNNSFIHCTGLITGGGFETPAEAIHLGKKLMTIPIRGQYEQQCNAAALTQLGIKKLASIDNGFGDHLYAWMNSKKVIQMDYSNSIGDSLAYVFANIPVRENIETYMIE
ncbi:MAG: hypothetical protein EOO01_07020 [Chitinophagaceae bacterium]|nr:MAG: hypothetical protein EOO01_07020 [Chitinophagaceae bacterium]